MTNAIDARKKKRVRVFCRPIKHKMASENRPIKRRRRRAREIKLQCGKEEELVSRDALIAASPYFSGLLEDDTKTTIEIPSITTAQLSLIAIFCRESFTKPFRKQSKRLPHWCGQFDIGVSDTCLKRSRHSFSHTPGTHNQIIIFYNLFNSFMIS